MITAGRLGWVKDNRAYAVPSAPEPVEQVLRVERGLQVRAGDARVDRFGRLGVLARTGLDGQPPVGEAQPDRGVAFGDEGYPLDCFDELARFDDGLGVDRRGEDRGHLRVVAVEQAGRRSALSRLETDQPVATGAGAERQGHRPGGAQGLRGVREGAGRDERDVTDPGLPGVQDSSRVASR